VSSGNFNQLEEILKRTEKPIGKSFSKDEIDKLSLYYRIVLKWNIRLHLTTITEPQDFVDRHISEAAYAEKLIAEPISQVWDLGTGLGVPGIPIAIFRPQISVYLGELKLTNTQVVFERIESLPLLPHDACITARAVEKMEKILPEIFRIGSNCNQILIFGTPRIKSLVDRLIINNRGQVKSHLVSGSDQRFIFDIAGST